MRNFRIQDRAAPNLSCATGLSVESILRIRTSPKRFSVNLLEQFRAVHRSKSGPPMSESGQSRRIDMLPALAACPLHLQ